MQAFKWIDVASLTLDQLLEQVEREHAPVQLSRNGKLIAEIRPIGGNSAWRLQPLNERLRPVISATDAVSPLDDEDWPAEARS